MLARGDRMRPESKEGLRTPMAWQHRDQVIEILIFKFGNSLIYFSLHFVFPFDCFSDLIELKTNWFNLLLTPNQKGHLLK
jgi:hypothetical protein